MKKYDEYDKIARKVREVKLMKHIPLITYANLERLVLPEGVFNTEGNLKLIKDARSGELKLLKTFKDSSGLVYVNKVKTLESLLKHKEELAIDELVYPEEMIKVGGEGIGYVMPYFEASFNLGTRLKNSSVTRSTKIAYLKAVGMLLRKIKELRESTGIEFFINDLHENNFIVDKNGTVRLVDIDSVKIDDNLPFRSKYLGEYGAITNFSRKYKRTYYRNGLGKIEPNENTDLYCYIMMIVNFLSNSPLHLMGLQNYHNYLLHLKEIGVPIELIYLFERVYTNEDNVNPVDLLDELIPFIDMEQAKVLKPRKKFLSK